MEGGRLRRYRRREQMPDQDIAYLSLSHLIDHYRTRTLSPIEVVRNALEQIEAFNGPLNAFVSLSPERALEGARLSEQRWFKGEPKGLLDGVPISVKDTLMVKGFPFRRGSRATSEEPVTESAPAVDHALDSGAALL